VGFYSGFIVADKITVESRRAGLPPEQGVRWTAGQRRLRGRAITRAERGTSVILHLREDARSSQRLAPEAAHQQILRPHQPAHPDGRESGRTAGGRPARPDGQDRRVGNRQQGQRAVDAAQEGHHRRAVHRVLQADQPRLEPPLAWTHNRVEGSTEYTQLLYIPATPFDLWDRDKKAGVKLYVKRVFIMDDAER
jgi:molecular chaperone HtpG